MNQFGRGCTDEGVNLYLSQILYLGFPGSSVVKTPSANAGEVGLISGLGRSTGDGNGNPLQYSCLENSMDRGAWQATVHGITKSKTRLSDFTSRHVTSLQCLLRPT